MDANGGGHRGYPGDEREHSLLTNSSPPFYTFVFCGPRAHTHSPPFVGKAFPSVHTRGGGVTISSCAHGGTPVPRPGPGTEWVARGPHPCSCKKGTCHRQSHICGPEDSPVTPCCLIRQSSSKALNSFQDSSGSSCGLGSDPCPTPLRQ